FRFTNIEIDSLGEAFGLGNTRLMGAYGISPLQPQSRCDSGGTSLPPLIEIRPYDPCPRRRSATLFHAFIVPVLRSRCPRIYSIFRLQDPEGPSSPGSNIWIGLPGMIVEIACL